MNAAAMHKAKHAGTTMATIVTTPFAALDAEEREVQCG